MSSKHYIGLTDQEVLKSRELNGSNELVAPESDPAWKEFLLKFTGPFGHLFKKNVGPNVGEEYEDGDPLIFVLEIAAVLSFLVSCSQYYGWFGIMQQGIPGFRQQRLFNTHPAAFRVAPARQQQLIAAQVADHPACAIAQVRFIFVLGVLA